jgi:hypothetical protein
VLCLIAFNDTNIQPYFELANFFKDIFNLFSKVLKIKKKKTAANTRLAKVAVQHSARHLLLYSTFVLRIGICGYNRHLRQAWNR